MIFGPPSETAAFTRLGRVAWHATRAKFGILAKLVPGIDFRLGESQSLAPRKQNATSHAPKARKSSLPSLALLLLSLALPAQAFVSTSSGYKNGRSAIDAGGGTQNSNSFQSISTIGEIGSSTQTSANFLARSGLIPIYFYPGQVSNFSVSGCVASQITLSWIAPGNDGYAAQTAARSYLIKLSSDPALSPAASETLFYSAQSVTPAAPTPAVQGTTQTLTLTGLQNGVTYYFAILALEADLSPAALLSATTSYPGVGSILSGFTAVPRFKSGLLSWNAAAGVPGNCTPVAYRLYRSTNSGSGFTVLTSTSSTSVIDSPLTVATTYYYQLFGLNSGNQEITAAALASLLVRGAPPTPPLRLSLSVFSSSATLAWTAPVAYDFGQAFASPSNPSEDELKWFHIWRSTGISNPNWTLLATVSSSTLQYTDPAPVAGTYYRVTAANLSDNSYSSIIRDLNSRSGWVLAPDQRSHMLIPLSALGSLDNDPSVAYWLRSSSQIAASGSNILNNANFQLLTQNAAEGPKSFQFSNIVYVRLSYQTNPDGTVKAQAAATPDQTGMYWNNGAKYVKVYGNADKLNQFVTVPTQVVGEYQLRTVTRQSATEFDLSGLSHKFLTPNGDGLNDNIQFTFDNPKDSAISGKIFDVQGRLVTTLSQTDQFHMIWDGKANGNAVPGGVYIYQLEGDGKVYNGTVVVIK